MQEIKQSTSTLDLVFLLTDSAGDPVTGETPTVTLSKNGGSFSSPVGSVSEIANGFYKVAANSTDNNTLGILALNADDGAGGTAQMAYNVVENLESDTISAIATVDGNVDSILTDTDTTIPALIAALNDLSAAQVNAEVDSALADYDAPTKSELDAGLAGLNDLSVSDILDATNGVESGVTLRQSLRAMLAVLTGECSGGSTTTITFRDPGDTADRVTLTVDEDGDRSAVTLNL